MGYTIYCYRPLGSTPNLEEAQRVIDDTVNTHDLASIHPGKKLILVREITNYNPRLEIVELDRETLVTYMKLTEENAEDLFNHIELNTPEEDIPVQITVYDTHVDIDVYGWGKGAAAQQLIVQLKTYIKIISDTAGYFVYDPQTEQVFDPGAKNYALLREYLSDEEPDMDQEKYDGRDSEVKKPWWKFW